MKIYLFSTAKVQRIFGICKYIFIFRSKKGDFSSKIAFFCCFNGVLSHTLTQSIEEPVAVLDIQNLAVNELSRA